MRDSYVLDWCSNYNFVFGMLDDYLNSHCEFPVMIIIIILEYTTTPTLPDIMDQHPELSELEAMVHLRLWNPANICLKYGKIYNAALKFGSIRPTLGYDIAYEWMDIAQQVIDKYEFEGYHDILAYNIEWGGISKDVLSVGLNCPGYLLHHLRAYHPEYFTAWDIIEKQELIDAIPYQRVLKELYWKTKHLWGYGLLGN